MIAQRDRRVGLVIAERTFESGSPAKQVELRIGAPRPRPEGDWYCPFQIVGLDEGTVKEAYGVDPLQALLLCVEMVKVHIEELDQRHELCWLGQRDLGLSRLEVPPALSPAAALARAPRAKIIPLPVPPEAVIEKEEPPPKEMKKVAAKRKPAAPPMITVLPDARLGAIVGVGAMSRKDVTKKLWAYIKRHGLQDRKNKRLINPDDKLRAVLGGKLQVNMSDGETLVDKHLK